MILIRILPTQKYTIIAISTPLDSLNTNERILRKSNVENNLNRTLSELKGVYYYSLQIIIFLVTFISESPNFKLKSIRIFQFQFNVHNRAFVIVTNHFFHFDMFYFIRFRKRNTDITEQLFQPFHVHP